MEIGDVARNGERFLVPAIFEPMAREVLDRIGLEEGDQMLDVACGSGVVAREASRRGVGGSVGLDLSRERLRVAARTGACCRAPAEKLPFRDDSFTLLTCQHGLMFFRDRGRALREAHRVLRPGGRFAATCWEAVGSNRAFDRLNRAIGVHLGKRAAASAAVPFSLPDSAALRAEVSACGFESVRAESLSFPIAFPSARDFAERFLISTSLAPFVRDDEQGMNAVLRDVEDALRPDETETGLEFEGRAYCILGRRNA